MSSLSIYAFATTVLRAVIQPDTSSQQQVTLMAEDVLVLNFVSATVINFKIGDYCLFTGKLYQINKLPKRTRKSTRRIEYNLQMEAEMYDLAKVEYLFLNSTNVFTESVFPLRGTLQDFADLIIHNMNRVFPLADWILGQIEVTDYQTISFSAQNCLQALQSITTAFNTEYIVDGKTINIYQRQNASNIVLEYGFNKSLLELTETDQTTKNIITRLYAYGSTKNISLSYRGGAQRLRMGDTPYIEKNVDLYRVNEFAIIFDGTNGTKEIYPHRTGLVSAVDDKFTFYDSLIDFDVNAYLISGIDAQITFNTGLLSGYTFSISSFDNSTKKFLLNLNTTDPNFIVPSDSFKPAIGDTYVITQINQPQSYIDAAEAELRASAQSYLNQNSIPPIAYSCVCNPKWFKDNNRTFNLTDTVQVLDEGMSINRVIRITGYTRNFINIFAITMTLSDKIAPKSIVVKLLNGI